MDFAEAKIPTFIDYLGTVVEVLSFSYVASSLFSMSVSVSLSPFYARTSYESREKLLTNLCENILDK